MAINNLVIISDLHAGCQFGLCPPEGIELDGGGNYKPSALQCKVWEIWQEFWNEWVPTVSRGEPFAVVVNGDSIDGTHHKAVTQISHNLSDQAKLAEKILKPIADRAAELYMIRGTEAHVGKSGQEEERLARSLGAKPDQVGRYARDELFIEVGGVLCHIMHHIGTTSSSQHEASAINAEMAREFNESARWGERVPLFVVRSHRHRYARVSFPARTDTDKHVESIGFCTPGWQLKTPFTYRIAGARLSPPQLGGAIIRSGDEDVYSRHFTRVIERDHSVMIESL